MTTYIINTDNEAVAIITDNNISAGTFVEFSNQTSNGHLVNARSGKISRAKKWAKYDHLIIENLVTYRHAL